MEPESEKPLRLLVNPFTLWTNLAFKTGEALWASAHAAVVRANAPKVAVIPTADAPTPKPQTPAKPAESLMASAHAEAVRTAKVAVLPVPDAPPRKARASVRQPSKAVRFKASRAKVRSNATGKGRARR